MEQSVPNLLALNLLKCVTEHARKGLTIDLSMRQLNLLLHVYLVQDTHSVKSLSQQLGMSKPAVCRAIDALSRLDMLKRKVDENDRRNVHIQRTLKGTVFLSEYAEIVVKALKTVSTKPSAGGATGLAQVA